MITNEAFVLMLGVFLGSLVLWAFKRLPEERWQFLASVPVMKDSSGHWRGINFTYYGLFTANALAFGVALLIVLFGALHINTPVTLALILVLLLICLPSARWVAQLIEGKPCSFTIAGAFFVGIFATPAMIYLFNSVLSRAESPPIPVIPALAAFTIAYAFGEGLGRLACISFGCCYGVALVDSHPLRPSNLVSNCDWQKPLPFNEPRRRACRRNQHQPVEYRVMGLPNFFCPSPV